VSSFQLILHLAFSGYFLPLRLFFLGENLARFDQGKPGIMLLQTLYKDVLLLQEVEFLIDEFKILRRSLYTASPHIVSSRKAI
jgi:hypothetical protein